MSETQVKDATAALRRLSRRAFLPGLIVGVAGLNTLLIRYFIPKVASTDGLKDRPKHQRHPLHKIAFMELGLTPGFYLDTVSGIIHYFSAKTAQFYRENNGRLKPVDPTKAGINLTNAVSAKPRVNLSRASFFFEEAAAVEIQKNEIENACNLLLFAIQYELQSAYRASRVSRFPPYKKAPSYRLYDLLAGVSVRANKPDYLSRMIEMIKKSPDRDTVKGFETRIAKWQDSNSKWHSRWSNTNKPMSWTATNGLVLPM
jgi:hypothetical protein